MKIFKALNTVLKGYITETYEMTAAESANAVAEMALGEKVKLTTVAILAQAKAWLATPAGAITAIVGGIVAAVAITDKFTTSLKEHQEELSNLKQEYSDLSQKLDELNKQYSDNTEKISELNKLKKEGSITATQDNELSSLKEINAQLALQIELQEQLKASKSKDSSEEFVATAKALLDDHNYSSENTHISDSGIILHNQISGIEKTEEEVAKYKKAQDKLIALQDSGIDVTSKKFAKQKKKIENEANEATDFLSKYLEEINNTLSNKDYFKDPTDQWQKDTNEMYDRLSTARAKIMLLLNKGDPNGTVFNSILNSAKYEKAAKSLSNLGKAGDLTGSKIKQMAKSDSNLKDLIDELKELGLFDGENFNELANQFNKVESGADDAAQSVKTFKDVIDGISDSSGKIDSLSKAFEDFSKNGTLSWDSIKGIGEGFSDVQGIQDYVNTLAQAGLTSGQFNDVASALASSLLSQDAATGKLNGSTADLYVKMLESCGIENALAIITAILSGANYGADSSARTAATGIGAMGTAAGNSAIGVKGAKDALVGFSGVSIDTSGIVSQFNNLGNAAINSANSVIQSVAAMSGAVNLAQKANPTAPWNQSPVENKSEKYWGNKNNGGISIPPLSFKPVSPSGGGKGGNGGGGSKAEPYKAEIDDLYKQKQKLKEIEENLDSIKSKIELIDDDDSVLDEKEKVALLDQQVELYKEQQVAMHDLNESRRVTIQKSVDSLKEEGFVVDYDANANKLLIENKEHLNELNAGSVEETNKLIKKYEDLIKKTEELNDANIEQSKKWYDVANSIKEVKKQYNELFENEVNYQKDRISLIKDSIDHEKSLLEDRKDIYDKHKTDVETLVNVIKESIDKQKDALQQENDTLDKQIDLQKKLQDLENAKSQKNKRIFRDGEGYVWEADAQEIKNRQSEFDKAVRDNELDAKIKALEEYEKKWQEVIDGYEKKQNKAKANELLNQILGYNWNSDNYWTLPEAAIGDFTKYYSDQCDQLNEDVDGSVASQIKNLEALSKQWDETEYQIERTANDYEGKLNDVKEFEKLNYADRLKYIQNFTKEAIAALEALARAQKKISEDNIIYNDPSGSDGSGDSHAPSMSAGADGDGTRAFSNGGVADFTGPAMLHGASAAEMILNNADVSKVYEFIHDTSSISRSVFGGMNVNSFKPITSSSVFNQSQSPSISIGDIYVSGVQDVDGLAIAIRDELPNIALQEIYKNK